MLFNIVKVETVLEDPEPIKLTLVHECIRPEDQGNIYEMTLGLALPMSDESMQAIDAGIIDVPTDMLKIEDENS